MQKFYLLAFCTLAFLTQLAAQRPNPANRLPATPDMPEWAKQIYRDDSKVNVFELDAEFKPWKEAYETLKREINQAGPAATEAQKAQLLSLKQYYKYYTRWRMQVNPYIQPDGSLDFTIKTYKDAKPKPEGQAKSMPANWSYLGPVATYAGSAAPNAHQVNVYSMDIAPSNASILYCGSEAGVVNKTTDKGLTWTQLGADFFTGAGIEGIAIHPTNPDIVYVAEGDKVQTTTNGGATWSTALGGLYCNDIKIKPDEPEVVLASGSSLQRRTAGNVWTNVLNMPTYDIAFKPNDPLIVYVLVRNAGQDLAEFWKSTDGGLTFTIRSTGWITGLTDGGGRLTVTPADNNRIYAVLLTGSGPRVMRSSDAGETWTIIASSSELGLIGPCTAGALSMSNGQGYYDLSIAASHTNADHIILGTTTSFKSTDGGVTYSLLGGYCGPFPIHADIQEMAAKGGDTWIATDGGMNLSTDFYTSTANHSARINALRGTEFWGFDQGWNEDVQVGGRYHNGNTARREAYPAGDHLFLGGGEAATGYLNPGNPAMAYFSDIGGRILPASINGNVGGFTVSKFPNEGYYAMYSGEQEWDPRYMYTYYLGNGNKFWKTTDNGLTFTSLFTHSSPTALIRYVEVSRSNPDVIYFTVQNSGPDDGELWKTTNGGANWTQCSNPGTLSAGERAVSKITMSGTDANTLWWCFGSGPNGQKVFKSTDGGATWTNWTTSTLDNVGAADILHQLGTDGGVYFVSGNGGIVFYRDNAASDWTPYNTGLPLNLYGNPGGVYAKAYYKGGKLRVAGGNGIWEAPLFTSSTTTLVQPMTDHATSDCSRDTIQLESYSVVNGAATYQWALSPAPQWISDANIRNPRIVLSSTPGAHSATLTVTDANGVTSRTVTNFINNLPSGNLCAAEVVPGKSLSLNGSASALANGNLNLNSNTVTFTAWVKRNGYSYFPGLVSVQGGTTDVGLFMNDNNTLRYNWNGNGGFSFSTAQTLPDNVWAHVALVITPADATIYINGVAQTNPVANSPAAFDAPLVLGGSEYGLFAGQMDEVSVWNKSLTQNEVRELMHLTLVPASQPNLKSYYQFNEASGFAFDKVGTRHVSLVNSTRVVSTGPFGGGTSNRQTVTTGGLKTFTGTDVLLRFPAAGTYPNGEIVVNRINLAPDSLPTCTAYTSDNHYWIIDNYGTNQTFTALDSMRLGNISVPATNVISPTSYKLNRRTANAHLLPWTLKPGTSIGATGGASGRITFGTASSITQFGQFIATACGNTISGTVLWEHDGTSGVNLATVKLTGDQTATTTTNISGAYSLIATSGSNFTVTPTKNINKFNGVTVGDALAVQLHVANIIQLPAPFKRIAADVNKSNSITTLDAALIVLSLAGSPSANAQFNTSWRFVRGSYTFPNPNVPWGFPEKITLTGVSGNVSGQDFKGIKLGDVIATFANPANFGPSSASPLVFNVQDQILQSGSQIVAEFSANQFENLAAFQMALRFNPAKLQLTNIQPLTEVPLTTSNFGTYTPGEIRAAWSQTQGVLVDEGASVFRLKFNVLQSGGKLSEALYLDEAVLPGLAYTSTLIESNVKLNFLGTASFLETTGTGDPVVASGLQLFQNQPNPFSGNTSIGFVLPESCEAQLRIFDVSGRMLAERKGQYAAGKHEELFELKDAVGVLCYELTTPFGVLAKKMVAYGQK